MKRLCIPAIIRKYSISNPNKTALVYKGKNYSYKSLDQYAGFIQNEVQKHSQGKESIVGIHLDRGFHLISSIIGTLAAGSAYLAFVPGHPEKRLKSMIQDASPSLIITERKYTHLFSYSDIPLFVVDERPFNFEYNINLSKECLNDSERLAYVLYTSGSTGKPKGVMIEHKALNNLLDAYDEIAPLAEDCKMLSFTPLSFDVSVWELFVPFYKGGTLYLMDDHEILDLNYFVSYIYENEINTSYFPPAILYDLLPLFEKNASAFPLKRILLGVEGIKQEVFQAFRKLSSDLILTNGYGPTEATVFATYFNFTHTDDPLSYTPIGKPIPGMHFVLLDQNGKKLTGGEVGEIYIGGKGLARAYLNEPETNKKAFIDNPDPNSPWKRLYKTGDLGVLNAEGQLLFKGRVDNQLKIRGYRVEAGEIESAINQVELVDRSYVTIVKADHGMEALTAYIQSSEEKDRIRAKVKESLTKALPYYMIPEFYEVLSKFPQTSHGKIDRKKLPSPKISENKPAAYEPPKGNLEKKMAKIWCEVLNIEKCGRMNHFFEYGGNSLKAAQFISRIKTNLGLRISLDDFFNKPFIAEIAKLAIQEDELSQSRIMQKRTDTKNIPLSYEQLRPWFVDRQEQERNLYLIPFLLKISGGVDFKRIYACIDQIIIRHDSLRTYFPENHGLPTQNILDHVEWSPQEIDLSKGREHDIVKAVHEKTKEIMSESIPLHKAPLFRVIRIKAREESNYLFFVFHHIIFDGWSMGLFIKELSDLYNAGAEEKNASLTDIEWQYKDYVYYQKDMIRQGLFKKDLAYWKERLQGLDPVLDFPLDYVRPARFDTGGGLVRFDIPAEQLKSIRQFAVQRNLSSYLFLFSVYALFLRYLCGKEDFLIGTEHAGRSREELEHIMGFFSNTLMIRCEIGLGLNFNEVLDQIKKSNLEAFEHNQVPFDKLIEELNIPHQSDRNPLFQTLFNYQNMPLDRLSLGRHLIEEEFVDLNTSKLDLSLTIREHKDYLSGEWEYPTALFSEQSIRLFSDCYKELIAVMLSNPSEKIADMQLFNPIVLQPLLKDRVPNVSANLIELLNIGSKNEEKIALVSTKDKLSYGRLEELSNSLANRLLSSGVSMSEPVGVFVIRSVETIVALLGILKSGAAFLPLDPEYPKDRLNFIVEDSRLRTILVDDLMPDIENKDIKILPITGDKILDSNPPTFPQIKGTDLAYIIYTSGSTGNPKGVAVEHHSISNFVSHTARMLELEENDRVLQFASLNFDTSLEEIFPALCRGASIVLRSDSMLNSLDSFINECREYEISILDLPTAFWHHLVAGMDDKLLIPESVRSLIIGGEAARADSLEKWFKYASNIRLFNTYGPTETTVVSVYQELKPGCERQRIAIGLPVSNSYARVLNENLQDIPQGAVGELYIGGDCLARGYLHQAERTAERFLKDKNRPGGRLYRTGDRVRLNNSGLLEYIGRSDNQLKIRGFRVELEEIESVIGAWEGIENCGIAVREHSDNVFITAFIKSIKKQVNIDQLKAYLREKLPDYMIPGRFEFIDEIPLTPNKKIDRKQLVQLEEALPNERTIVHPKTKLQEELLAIWKQVLGLESVGIKDDFFNHGGNSLLSIQLNSKLRSAYGLTVPLKEFYNRPTVEFLAEIVDSQMSLDSADANFPLEKAAPDQDVQATASQMRLWFVEKLEDTGGAYNIPIQYDLSGSLGLERFKESLELLCRNHEILRTSFFQVNDNLFQKIHDEFELPFTYHDFSDMPAGQMESQLQQVIEETASYRFDFEKLPLFLVVLVKLDTDKFRLILNFNHIISDNYSVGVFIRSMNQAYNDPENLKKPEYQYRDYAHWQSRFLEKEPVQKQLDYWKKELNKLPAISTFPEDFQRKSRQSFKGKEVYFKVPDDFNHPLSDLCEKLQMTDYMILLSAFSYLLGRWSGQKDICIGSPVANRTLNGTDQMMGVFINNLAFRFEFEGKEDVKSYLNYIRNKCLDGFSNQDLPFEWLLNNMSFSRDLRYTPVFQVLFNYLNAHQDNFNFKDVDSRYLEIPGKSSKFDLTLTFFKSNHHLKGIFEYNTDLYSEDTISLLISAYLRVLEQFVKQPSTSLDKIGILSSDKENEFLYQFNQTSVELPEFMPIQDYLDIHAEETKDKVYIHFGEDQYTYHDVHEMVGKYASCLQRSGIKEGHRVAVYLERRPEYIFSVLSVLKCGACFIPIDPLYPSKRVEAILEESDPHLIISDNDLLGKIEAKQNTLSLDETDFSTLNHSFVPPAVSKDRLAYIIFTSGSTGRPKGVEIKHEGLMNFIISMSKRPGISKDDVLLALTTFSFDISYLELFAPLYTGAGIVLSTSLDAKDPDRIMELLGDKISIVQATPTTWEMLKIRSWKGRKGLKILCGGEAMSASLALYLTDCCDQLWNMYGPTETTIWSSLQYVDKSYFKRKRQGSVSIGKPIDNTFFYVLDENQKILPPNVAGRLFIGGKGLAKSYFRRPDLSNEVFVDNPFVPGEKMYNTGDLAKYDHNGTYYFIGRDDGQVKIRGFRIELGEVENALTRYKGIDEAVVKVWGEDDDAAYLAAYYVASEDNDIPDNLFKDFLKDYVPAYMMPTAYIRMDELPKTANNKIDRKKLPDPKIENRAQSKKDICLPANEPEKIIYEIWEELLHTKDFSIDEDFFDMGGHSLLAVKMMSLIEGKTGKRLPLSSLFNYSTVRSLADYMTKMDKSEAWSCLVPIRETGNRTPLYIIHGAGLNILLFNTLAKHLDSDQPVYGVQAKGLNGVDEPLESIEEMAAYYISEIKKKNPDKDIALAGFSLGGIIAFEMAGQLKKKGNPVKFLGLFDTVAYSSHENLSFHKKCKEKLLHIFGMVTFNALLFMKNPVKTFNLKMTPVRRKIQRLWWNFKGDRVSTTKEGLPVYALNVRKASDLAGGKYHLKEYDGCLQLFRAEDRSFYVKDKKYLSWGKYAPGKVIVHPIPGDHSDIFAPPNDEKFASILQKALDECCRNKK